LKALCFDGVASAANLSNLYLHFYVSCCILCDNVGSCVFAPCPSSVHLDFVCVFFLVACPRVLKIVQVEVEALSEQTGPCQEACLRPPGRIQYQPETKIFPLCSAQVWPESAWDESCPAHIKAIQISDEI
jgi:hypothetical protein